MARSSFPTAGALGLASLFTLMIGCGRDATAPSDPPTISMLIVSGNSQSGVVGAELPTPLQIMATDSKGKAISDLTVNFRVTDGGGSVFAGAASTDNKGIAQDYWTLGTSTAGPQTLEVRAVLSNGQKQVLGVFTATALPDAAAHIEGQATDSMVPAGTAVPTLPAVLVSDRYGNPVPFHSVTFAIGLGGGTITGAAATTNASGIATVGSWTLGLTPGPNTLTATAAGSGISGNPVTFNVIAI